MEYSYVSMKNSLENNKFHFKKKFGQNFICDENLIDKIINNVEIDKDTLVVEIGPGYGTLTNKIAFKAKNVLCFEIDTTLKPILEENLKEHKNIEIVFEDFLKTDVLKYLQKYKYNKLYMVANLPYYITTPIIMKIIEDKIPFDKISVMVQKEVADRFSAKPNTKDYNSLTIYLNYYYNVRKVMNVSRKVFTPEPKVDSMIVEFTKKPTKLFLTNEEIFFKLVRDSFKQKRKTIKNNLKNYDLTKIESVLKEHGFDLNTRAEQIPDDIFALIANKIG